MIRMLELNPHETAKGKRKLLDSIERARAAGHHYYADTLLSLSMSLGGWNRERIVRDDAYWEEFQRIMLGRRMSKIEYLFSV